MKILFKAKAINRPENNLSRRSRYRNGDWVYGLVSKEAEVIYDLPAEMTNTDGISGIEVDYKTISPAIDVLDKYYKEIFKGDIVKLFNKEVYGVVKYDKGAYYVDIYNTNEKVTFFKDIDSDDVEVIGNIYDNSLLADYLRK